MLDLFDRKAPPPTCFECDHVAEHRHHVVPRSMGGTRTVWLCTKCHAAAHHFEKDPWMNSRNLIKNGLKKARERGVKLGSTGALRAAENKAKSDNFALEIAPLLYRMQSEMGLNTLEKRVQYLNRIGYKTPMNKKWHIASVHRMEQRLERMEQELAQKRAA